MRACAATRASSAGLISGACRARFSHAPSQALGLAGHLATLPGVDPVAETRNNGREVGHNLAGEGRSRHDPKQVGKASADTIRCYPKKVQSAGLRHCLCFDVREQPCKAENGVAGEIGARNVRKAGALFLGQLEGDDGTETVDEGIRHRHVELPLHFSTPLHAVPDRKTGEFRGLSEEGGSNRESFEFVVASSEPPSDQ